MGVYETLFKFADATHKYMGDPGTHPWAQGYPLTTQIPGGPELPKSVEFDSMDLKYPKATGELPLLDAIADYYNHFYDAGITSDNVAVFAGGRPAIFATLAFLLDDTTVALEATEYTPYYDILNVLNRNVHLVQSNAENRFRPAADDYDIAPLTGTSRVMLVKSNPCNPTGVAVGGAELKQLVETFSASDKGALIDEAYEFFCDPEPQSALRHIDDIDATNIFVIGAATKGLQVPGMRIGWAIAAKQQQLQKLNRATATIGNLKEEIDNLDKAIQCFQSKLPNERWRAAFVASQKYFSLIEIGCSKYNELVVFYIDLPGHVVYLHWQKMLKVSLISLKGFPISRT